MQVILKTRCGCERLIHTSSSMGKTFYVPMFPPLTVAPAWESPPKTKLRTFEFTGRYDADGHRIYLEKE